MTPQEEQERYRYLQLKMKMSQSNSQPQPSLINRAKSMYSSYKQSPLYQASPQGMLETTDKLVDKGFNKMGEMAAEKMATTKNPFTKQPFSPNTSAAVGTGIQMAPLITKSLAGPIAEGMSTKLPFQGIKPTGPFTAGLKAPETALSGEFSTTGKALGEAKSAARAGEDIKDAARLRGLLAKRDGVGKLAEEGLKELKSGKDVSMTRLLAYKQALGKMQDAGGTFADDYAQGQKIASDMIAKKAPDLAAKLEKMHLNFLAKGNSKTSFPWFTVALDHVVGLMKAATHPVVRNIAGAATGTAARSGLGLSTAGNLLQKAFSKDDQ